MFASFRRMLSVGGGPAAADEGNRRSHAVRGFVRNKSGNVAMMFAFLAIPFCGAVGLAIDMGRIYHVNMATQSALDAAALAAGRVAQVEKKDTITKANKAASAYFDAIKPSDVVTSSIAFVPNSTQTAFEVTATSWIKTPFLAALNIIAYKGSLDDAPPQCKGNYYACAKMVSTATAQICLNCSDTGGGNSDDGKSLEISMMLDVTGSMKGQPLTDMIAAAKDLIDIVVWDDQSKYTSRVALAPFSAAVNVGDYFTAITGKSDDPDPDGDGYNYGPECYSKKTGKLITSGSSSCVGDSAYKVKRYAHCVTERTGTNAAKDVAPTDASSWLPPSSGPTTKTSPTCTPSAKIIPLTKDRDMLKKHIDTFTDGGSTAGQLGTAFAWYLLSPNWNTVWPKDSQPTAYGTAKVDKIAVLMTDGVYNTLGGKQYGDNSSEATTALTQAKAICTGMKGKSITVYTVGFNIDSTAAKDMLKACATSSSHYYDTSGGDALKAAFRDIALKISKLRLTN
jgi:Flp pilus assembly protein TadG